jgi:hypothetical protein
LIKGENNAIVYVDKEYHNDGEFKVADKCETKGY